MIKMGVARPDNYVVDNDDFNIDERPTQASSATNVGSGWDAADKQNAPTGGDFPVEYKHSEQYQLVKFIDENGPFATYAQHFLKQKTEGRRSYVCLGENCPLCNKLKDKPERKTAFSVVVITDGQPQRQMIIASPRFYKDLHNAHFGPAGPLTKNFWALNRTGKMQQTTYGVLPVKTRDLGEDWGVDAEKLVAQLAEFVPFTRDAIKTHSFAELLDVAEALV